MATTSLRTEARAVVRFDPDPAERYIVRVRGPADASGRFHLVVLGGNLTLCTSQGSIPFPGDGASVLAIGAVDAANRRLSYSSCGQGVRHPKPDFVAPVPFPRSSRPCAARCAAAHRCSSNY